MAYSLSFTRRAFKELEKIHDPFYSNIKHAITALAIDPRPRGCLKLHGRDGYRIRVGDYRIVYHIFDNQLVIEIIEIGTRQGIY